MVFEAQRLDRHPQVRDAALAGAITMGHVRAVNEAHTTTDSSNPTNTLDASNGPSTSTTTATPSSNHPADRNDGNAASGR